jgi:hypothetical protein
MEDRETGQQPGTDAAEHGDRVAATDKERGRRERRQCRGEGREVAFSPGEQWIDHQRDEGGHCEYAVDVRGLTDCG